MEALAAARVRRVNLPHVMLCDHVLTVTEGVPSITKPSTLQIRVHEDIWLDRKELEVGHSPG